jgi:ureidoglycolate hydrolase
MLRRIALPDERIKARHDPRWRLQTFGLSKSPASYPPPVVAGRAAQELRRRRLRFDELAKREDFDVAPCEAYRPNPSPPLARRAHVTLTANIKLASRHLKVLQVPTRPLTADTFAGYGRIVRSFADAPVDVLPWPVQGQRPLDPGTGVSGGLTEGLFKMRWKGDVLYAVNHAVGGSYVTGWACAPEDAREDRATVPRVQVLTCEANYHPDGGQIFFPKGVVPFVALLALPGDDVKPEDFVAFQCPGDFGIHIDPGVWHQPVYPLVDEAEFDDKQSAVHACVSVDFGKEFGCLLSVPLRAC